MSWKGLIAVVSVVAMFVVAGSALAASNIHFNAKVRILAGGDEYQYHGRVRSNVEACEVGRTVRITTRGHLIGKTGTAADGRFSVVARPIRDGSTVKFKLKPNGPECAPQKILVEL